MTSTGDKSSAVSERTGSLNSPAYAMQLERELADCKRALSDANAKHEAAMECCRLFWQHVDMMNDGPDDSDVALAQGWLEEAYHKAREALGKPPVHTLEAPK